MATIKQQKENCKNQSIQKVNTKILKYENTARPNSNNYNHIKSNHTSIKSKSKLVSKQKAAWRTQSAHLHVVSQPYSR